MIEAVKIVSNDKCLNSANMFFRKSFIDTLPRLFIIKVELFIPSHFGIRGRPPKSRAALARAFVSKAVYNMPTTEFLIDRLKADILLRRICGWENRNEILHASAFSRAFFKFAESGLPQQVHNTLIKIAYEKHLVGHISRDSTAIEAREKAHKKKRIR